LTDITELWEFKYSATTFEDMILAESIKPKLEKALVELPNIILSGPPGCGKGTFVNILLKQSGVEVLRINGSDETGIDHIRDKVKPFATASGFDSELKYVYINEADALSFQAQKMLRALMEEVQDITRFIFACNYSEAIIPEIKSRCQFIHDPDPPMKEIAQKCIAILKNEGVEYDTKDVISLVKQTYPDIRHTINTMKENVYDGVLSSDLVIASTSEAYDDVVKAMKSMDPSNVRKILRSYPIDYTRLYNHLYGLLMDSDGDVFGNDIIASELVAEHAYRNDIVSIKEINFMGLFIKMLRQGAV
jgi:replication factor C small subunit